MSVATAVIGLEKLGEWFRELFSKIPEYNNLTDTDVTVVTHNLARLASWSGIIGAVVALLILLVLLLINRYGRRYQLPFTSNAIPAAFAFVWLAGFVVYDLGMYVGEEGNVSLFTNMPMAAIYSFEMFLMESDISAIHPLCFNNWAFMTAFSLVHIFAAIVTLAFVIKHFGFNIVAGMRMLFESYFSRKKETYIFWGINDPSYILAKSIKNHFMKLGCKDYRIIVVRSNDGSSSNVRNGMERLFNFLSLRNNDLERLLKLDCLTTSTYADLAHVKIESYPDDVLKKLLNLNMLSRIIKRKTKTAAHLFFFGDDAADNIQAVANLKRDKTIQAFVDKVTGFETVEAKQGGDSPNEEGKMETREKRDNTVTLYCRARYNTLHRVIEDVQLHDRIEVKVIDPSHLSVEILKQQVKYHPVNYVDIEQDATVSSAFNALIVGFGEVGKDMLRFLYEFSAFVKTGTGTDDKLNPVQRSEYHLDVVDIDMQHQAGLFISGAPSIITNQTFASSANGQKPMVSLRKMDARSPRFYQELIQKIENLNYIVVCQGDDELNVSLAVRIFRAAVRYRSNMNHFRILVLVKNDEDKQYSRIIEHYNRLWAAEENALDPKKRTHQNVVKNDANLDVPISMFGKVNTVFLRKYIIGEALRAKAEEFKNRYDRSVEALEGRAAGSTPNWETEHKDLMQLLEPYKGYSPTLSGIMRLRRIQRQNIENCFHELTKQYLAQKALDDDYGVFAEKRLDRKENEITYTWTSGKENQHVIDVLNVLARTEHFRWMASHEVLGYIDYGTEDDKDEARLMHGCLKPWESLSTRVQSYDYNVVDVSLGVMEVKDTPNDK